MQFIEDVIENRMNPMTVFDLSVPMPEHDWGDYH